MTKIRLKEELAKITGFSINNKEELAYIIKRAKTDLCMCIAEDDPTLIPTQSLDDEAKRQIIDWCKNKKIVKEIKPKSQRGYITQAVMVDGKRRFVSLSTKYRKTLEMCGVTDFYSFLSEQIKLQGSEEKNKSLTARVQEIILETFSKRCLPGFPTLSELQFENMDDYPV